MAMITINNLDKMFGANTKKALSMLDAGKTKDEILRETGCTIAINGASFSIEKKEIFVVMGLSGSGKSTMIRCLNRLIDPTRGEVLIDGKDIMKMDQEELRAVRRDKMSMVFQHFGLLPHRNVISNIEYGLEISGMEKVERRKKAQKAIDIVGLSGYEQSMPSELSGGMQQRVGLARALANDPEILLMDEAFSALDPLIRTQMQDELLKIQAKMHKTIVFITHDLDEALTIGDRIVILGPDGRVRQIGTPEEILSSPADDYVKAFVQNVDRTKVITASSIMRRYPSITIPREGSGSAMRMMEKYGVSSILVTDHDRVLKGALDIESAAKLAKKKEKDVSSAIRDDIYTTTPDTAVSDLLGTALATKYPIAVIDDEGKLLGAVDRAAIIAELSEFIEDDDAPTVLSEVDSVEDDAK
jgi:glycine betaine/proline transport system ATP-binding protein